MLYAYNPIFLRGIEMISSQPCLVKAPDGKCRLKCRLTSIICMVVAMVSLGFCGLNIKSLSNENLRADASVPVLTVKRAGHYTLFVQWLQPFSAGPFQMVRADNHQVIPSQPVSGREQYVADGRTYNAACNFEISIPGTYRVLGPNKAGMAGIMMAPALTAGLIWETVAAFFAGLVSFLAGFCSWHPDEFSEAERQTAISGKRLTWAPARLRSRHATVPRRSFSRLPCRLSGC